MIEVIVPPPDVKAIIDKLAEKVLISGKRFEQIVLEHQAGNPKFNFLKFEDDPYRPYYLKKLDDAVKPSDQEDSKTEVKENGQVENQREDGGLACSKPENQFQNMLREQIFVEKDELKEPEEIKPPPPDLFQIVHPQVAPVDMDTIKLTAQFVAKNGQKFLQGLTQRESKNPQFDFLKPTHNLFSYFTSLVESYSRVLLPKNETLNRYSRFAEQRESIQAAGEQRQIYEDAVEKSKMADKQDEDSEMTEDIDWHDFVVVEQIELYEDEEMNQQDVEEENELEGIQQSIKQQIQANRELEAMPDPNLQQQNEPVVSKALDPDMKIVKNYERKVPQDDKKVLGSQKCPNCKADIPKTEWREHFKICVLDKKWKEQKQQRIEREAVHGEDDQITNNLKRFAAARPDLYSGNVEQLRETEQEPKVAPVIWDGQSATITRTTANIAMLKTQQARNITEAAKVTGNMDARAQELLEQSKAAAIQKTIIQFSSQQRAATSVSEEDAALEQLKGSLRAEYDWLRVFPGSIKVVLKPDQTICTVLPSDKQVELTIAADSRMKVFQLKEELARQLSAGIPAQKLIIVGTPLQKPLKDTLSLAFYNVPEGASLSFSVKQ